VGKWKNGLMYDFKSELIDHLVGKHLQVPVAGVFTGNVKEYYRK